MELSVLIIVIVLALVFAVILMYNSLVRNRNLVKNSYAQIDVQLKRRYDLIPNLVETAKGYMKHEKDTLEAVIKARNSAQSALSAIQQNPNQLSAMKDLFGADQLLSQSMGRLMALAEAYPDLKANSTMTQLMEELSSTENKVGFARQAYNDSVMTYNNSRESFPSVVIANAFGFEAAVPYQISNVQEKEAPKVSFS